MRLAKITTRTEIGEQLGLSPASISRIVRRLLNEGLVLEEPGESEGLGRNANAIRFNELAGSVIAIDLGGTKCLGVLADLLGNVLYEEERPSFANGNPEENLLTTIENLFKASLELELPVRSLGIGIPAVLDPDTGLITSGPNVQWEDFDLVSLLRGRLDEPFIIDNDVNLAALGEAWRGIGVDAHSFVTFSFGTGIGAAVVIDGELIRGRHNAAGEVGNILADRSQIQNFGPNLEHLISGAALVNGAREYMAKSPEKSELSQIEITPRSIFEAASRGDGVAQQVISDLVEHIALVVTNCIAFIDPELVVFEGSIGRALEPYLGRIEDLVERAMCRRPIISTSTLGPNATIIGAIASALLLDIETRTPMTQVSQRRLPVS
ncbi:MAG TPA: ROK family transcriptional regulator [Acidimicrobiales bacterium]